MTDRRSAFLAAMAAALLAAGASAAPTIAPAVTQCDGSYSPGNGTHAPFTTVGFSVEAQIQDASNGLRVGPAATRMGVVPSRTRALWRFDSSAANVVETPSCTPGSFVPPCGDGSNCGDGGPNLCLDFTSCAPVSTFAWTVQYQYFDANGTSSMDIGSCGYDATSCANGATVNSVSNIRTPLGLGTCPNPGTMTTAGSAATVFPTDAHFADSGNAKATFDGTTQFGVVGYVAGQWDLPASYTLSAWIKPANGGTGANMRVLSEQGSGYWGFGLNSSGQLRHFDSRDVSVGGDLSRGPNIADGAWHMITLVRNNSGATSGRVYYVDGVQVGVAPVKSTTSFIAAPISQNVYVGDFISGGEKFKGDIDEIRVIDGTLSADDVLLEYKGTVHKYSSNGGASYSTAVGSYVPAISNGTGAVGHYRPGEPPTANSVWIFEAQNLDTVSSVATPFQVVIDNSLPVAPVIAGAATSLNDISWTWGTPPNICVSPGTPAPGPYYQLADCASGATVTPPSSVFEPTRLIAENYAGVPNQLHCRRLKLTDVWGGSPLSAPTSAYTHAAAPTALTFTGPSISTASFIVSWNANSNPSYTRYELTYALNPGFTVGVATRAALADDFNLSSAAITGLTPGTTYYVRVRAFDGRSADFYAGANPPSSGYATGSVVTDPPAPSLVGTPQSNSSIKWDWTVASGATGYTLLDSANQAQLFAGANTTKLVSSLSVNTRYDAEVQADMPTPTPASARGHAFTYTWANAPVGLTASRLYESSATFTWGANGNPPDTFYELVVSSEPTFGVVVATLSVTGTTVTATNLFPGATYYARVRAFNGMQIATALAPSLITATAADPLTSQNSTPPSPYVTGTGLVGSWQFDEGSGLTTADSAGGGASAAFKCTTGGCVSTPTWSAGPAGLGSAASFSGLSAGVVVSASGAPFDFADDLTVEAWVNPASAFQPGKTGIVARGIDGSEDFALDVSPFGSYRFIPGTGLSVTVATTPIVAGQWTHVTGVYTTAGGGRSTLYLNGVAAAVTAGPASRSLHAGQTVSIGNRKDAGSGYTLPFFGKVDSVRIFHRALTSAEVLAEYAGSFVSSVTASAPNTGVIIALPPNAFSAPAQIYVSGDPVNHPIRVPIAALNAGLASPPDGLTLVPGSLTEVVPVVGGAAFTAALGSSATITLPYTDANGDNLIDGTNPPLAASNMRMYTLNTTVNRWELLPTTVDAAHRRASGVTPHFSVFALFAPTTVGSSVSGVQVYPVPWKPGTGGRFDGPGVTFARLPSAGKIRILTLGGRRVREFTYSGASAGTAVWDGLNDDGRRAASGVYFAKITSDADQKGELVKFAIER